MNELQPINQIRLFGLENFFLELSQFHKKGNFPNKLLLSGQKGLGKSTLAYHFINYVLSKNENYKYDIDNFEINPKNHSFKTVSNKSNTNFILIDITPEKKNIEINQIRELITSLNKSSFNNKPRFVLIDNIEFLNNNAINALLKILEEPSYNVHFILINNNKKILPTLLSRCINFKISLTNKQSINIVDKLLDKNFSKRINNDLLNYYLTPGKIYNLVKFGETYNVDLENINLKNFLKLIIKDNYYKKDNFMKYMVFDLIELYFNKINMSFSDNIYNKYSYFLKRISDTRNFNLDNESLFIEFNEEILNG
tara:strand:+ start:1113 stop:2045 length:933 start_codon:yes stop_codon:yes gene_type:complete